MHRDYWNPHARGTEDVARHTELAVIVEILTIEDHIASQVIDFDILLSAILISEEHILKRLKVTSILDIGILAIEEPI